MKTDAVLRTARAISPRGSRERRFEEWRADLAGCSELGLSEAGIALGALRLAAADRARLLLSLVARTLARARTVAIGVTLGAACALCDVPVLTVVVLALLLQGSVIAVQRWRARPRRSQSRPVEIRG